MSLEAKGESEQKKQLQNINDKAWEYLLSASCQLVFSSNLGNKDTLRLIVNAGVQLGQRIQIFFNVPLSRNLCTRDFLENKTAAFDVT